MSTQPQNEFEQYTQGGELPRPFQGSGQYPVPTQGAKCYVCGQVGTLRPGHKDHMRKKRTNHLFHLIMGVFTLSIWWWTVWPIITIVHSMSKGEVVSTDRFVVCTNCGAKQ